MERTLILLSALAALGLSGNTVPAYRYNRCYYEVKDKAGYIYLVDGYTPACVCAPDPATKDCTCTTTDGPGPNCTKVRCFAIGANFPGRGYYLRSTNVRSWCEDSGGCMDYWDYDMSTKDEVVNLENPCGIPALSSSESSRSDDTDDAAVLVAAIALLLPVLFIFT
jgi:hypothetical protein